MVVHASLQARRGMKVWLMLGALLVAPPLLAKELELQTCRLKGVAHEAMCGALKRPLNPDAPEGRAIDIHVAVLPALARNKLPDPIFFLAGGPGQSAIDLAGPIQAMLSRFGNRRDIVLIDQRGTGRSATLMCEAPNPWLPLAEGASAEAGIDRLRRCAAELQKLPHGDLRYYTTSIAVGDAEAVRKALGVAKINLIGASYGTRVALEYLRQFPQQARSAVLDGVAPPDMGLVASFSTDNQAALDAVWNACEADPRCRSRYPDIEKSWQSLLAGLPKSVTVAHPMNGRMEQLELTRLAVLGAVRSALYAPAVAAVVPGVIHAASQGSYAPLMALSQTMGPRNLRLAEGMHFAVVCSEDDPSDSKGRQAPGDDFGDSFETVYASVCQAWPRAKVSDDFRLVPPTQVPVLMMSGGADPATPPHHGQRVTERLGPSAVHLVIPHAAHGVLGLACVRDTVYRFVEDAEKRGAGVGATVENCAESMPRASAYSRPEPYSDLATKPGSGAKR
jgi:pimeloyl-ACP methyl ester carboxylesterase